MQTERKYNGEDLNQEKRRSFLFERAGFEVPVNLEVDHKERTITLRFDVSKPLLTEAIEGDMVEERHAGKEKLADKIIAEVRGDFGILSRVTGFMPRVTVEAPYVVDAKQAKELVIHVPPASQFNVVYDQVFRRLACHELHADRARYLNRPLLEDMQRFGSANRMYGMQHEWTREELHRAETALPQDDQPALRKRSGWFGR